MINHHQHSHCIKLYIFQLITFEEFCWKKLHSNILPVGNHTLSIHATWTSYFEIHLTCAVSNIIQQQHNGFAFCTLTVEWYLQDKIAILKSLWLSLNLQRVCECWGSLLAALWRIAKCCKFVIKNEVVCHCKQCMHAMMYPAIAHCSACASSFYSQCN